MGGFSIPGSTGDGITWHIDPGTKALITHLGPSLSSLDDQVLNWARREVRRGINQATHLVVDVACEAALRELRALRGDIEAQLRLIAGLPEAIRKVVAYDAFSSAFTHYLPKKFLRHFIWGGGGDLTLTLQEMIDCNPAIDIQNARGFDAALAEAAKQPGMPVPFKLNIPSAALTNGTLGQFTVHTSGTVVAGADGSWKFTGNMDFYDEWDFDPKSFSTGGRSVAGEVKTRVANVLLPGTSFKIHSESTAFSQSQADIAVVWAGGTPKAVLDKVAIVDVALTKPER